MNEPCVIRLLAEGGAIEVFGRQEPDGAWSFVTVGMHIDIGDDGNDSVRVGGVPRTTDLAECLPAPWILFSPIKVHPELRKWFRQRYDAAVAALPAGGRELHDSFRHHKWQALFASTPPDRWSEDDF